MNLLELKVGSLGSGHWQAKIIDLLVELIEEFIRNDGLKTVNDTVLIFFRIVCILIVAMQEFYSLFHVVTVWHVDQS